MEMKNSSKNILLALVGIFILASVPSAQADDSKDVTYFAVVKNHVFAQDSYSHVTETGYSFLAYIFVSQDSDISNAYLKFPGETGHKEVFPDFRNLDNAEKDTYLFIHSDKIYSDKEEYDRDFPDGTYTVEFATSSGMHRADIDIKGDVYPKAAVMTLYQQGYEAEPGKIDPKADLRVVWGGFPQGRADPNGILDDVVFVIVKDCHGGKVLHSGRPYQGFHLLYTDKDYTVPAGTMLPGRRYELIVDNGLRVDSNTDAGVPGVGFYAQTNKMAIQTFGAPDQNGDCPAGR